MKIHLYLLIQIICIAKYINYILQKLHNYFFYNLETI